MADGYALHIGLDVVDASKIDGLTSVPPPVGAVAAAHLMATIAQSRRFNTIVSLTDRAATADRVRQKFNWISGELKDGDLFVFSLAGHARPYKAGSDILRQEFLLYDYAWPDDEIFALLTSVRASARVVVVLEACYANGLITPGPFFTSLSTGAVDFLSLPVENSTEGISRMLKAFVKSPLGWRAAASSLPFTVAGVAADILVLAACNYDKRATASTPRTSNLPAFTYYLKLAMPDATNYVDLIQRITAMGLCPEPILNQRLLKPGSGLPGQTPFSV